MSPSTQNLTSDQIRELKRIKKALKSGFRTIGKPSHPGYKNVRSHQHLQELIEAEKSLNARLLKRAKEIMGEFLFINWLHDDFAMTENEIIECCFSMRRGRHDLGHDDMKPRPALYLKDAEGVPTLIVQIHGSSIVKTKTERPKPSSECETPVLCKQLGCFTRGCSVLK